IRVGWTSDAKETTVDPRINLRYEADPVHTFKAAVGQYSVSPEGPQPSKEFGNPELKNEKSMHYVLGVESRWADRWETDLQLYYKLTRDLIVNDVENRYSNDGSERSRGAELFIRRNMTDRAFGWLSYTYSQSEGRETDRE